MPPIEQKLADLECSIAAFRKMDGTSPIAGGTVAIVNKGTAIWLHYTVRNTGLRNAIDFEVKMEAEVNGATEFSHTETIASLVSRDSLTFPGGPQSMKRFRYELPVVENSQHVVARMWVDLPDTVPEKNEQNNLSSFVCDVEAKV